MIIVIILSLCLVLPAIAQDGLVHTWTDSVTLDSTDEEILYLGFYARRGTGTQGFSSSAITPKNTIHLTDDLLITGYIDSLKASTAKDSIAIKAEPLDKDGYVLADAVLWFDFTNHDTAATAQQISAYIPFNRTAPTLGVTNPTFWVDLSGLLKPAHAYKFTVIHTGDGATNDSSRTVLNAAQGLKGIR